MTVLRLDSIYSWFALDVIAVMLEKRQQKNLATTRNLNFTPLYGIMFFRYQLQVKTEKRKRKYTCVHLFPLQAYLHEVAGINVLLMPL